MGSGSQLRDLELVGAPISDHGLEHLAGLGRLISLDLGGTSVGDARTAPAPPLTRAPGPRARPRTPVQ